jgi:hypothetical protein
MKFESRLLSILKDSRLLSILKDSRLLSMLKEFRLLLLGINIDLIFFHHVLNVFTHLLIFLLQCIDQAEGSEYQVDSTDDKLFHSKRHFAFYFKLKFSRTLLFFVYKTERTVAAKFANELSAVSLSTFLSKV